MDAAGDLPQLFQHARQPVGDARQLRGRARRAGRYRRLGAAQIQLERDQALLDAVVQIALDPAARLVGGGDDPRTRGHQLGAALAFAIAVATSSVKPREPRLGVRRNGCSVS